MAGAGGWDAIVFGEVVFPEGGVLKWCENWHHRTAQLAALEAAEDEQLAQLLITPVGVAIRCWLADASFQEWCPRIEAMFAQAAQLGARGDLTFVGVGEGPAYRLAVEHGRASLQRIAAPGYAHPIVQEIALAVEAKGERRRAALRAAEAEIVERFPKPSVG